MTRYWIAVVLVGGFLLLCLLPVMREELRARARRRRRGGELPDETYRRLGS